MLIPPTFTSPFLQQLGEITMVTEMVQQPPPPAAAALHNTMNKNITRSF